MFGKMAWMGTVLVLGVLTVLDGMALNQTALGNDFAALPDSRVADPTGRYYVVFNREGGPKHFGEWGPTAFVAAERAEGTPPIESARGDVANLAGQGGQFHRMLEHPDVIVRPGDRVRGRGRFERPPRVVLVSSTGVGFVALDLYGPNLPEIVDGRGGHAVTVFSLDGELLCAKTLRDLFDDDHVARFRTLGNVVSWLRGAWINERECELVLLGGKTFQNDAQTLQDVLRVVNLVSGAVREGRASDVVEGLASADPEAVKQALTVALDWKLELAREPAGRMVVDASPDAQLHAAVLLAALGDRRGDALIRRAVSDDRPFYRAMALEYLPEAAGEAALPTLLAALQRGKSDGIAAFEALVKLSDRAVATVAPLTDSRHDRPTRLAAIGILGSIGPDARPAADALADVLDDDDPLIRSKGALALAAVDPRRAELLPALRAGLCVELDSWWAMPVREASAEKLIGLGPRGLATLGETFRDEDVSVRTVIAAALALTPDPSPASGRGEIALKTDLLIAALDDDDRTVRDWALDGLERLGRHGDHGRHGSDALVAALESPSVRIRSGSAFVLGRLGSSSPAAREALARALLDDDPSVRGAAAGAFRAIDPQNGDAVTTLVALLGHAEEDVRAKAAFRLGSFGPRVADVAVEPLIARLDDSDRVAAASAAALGALGPEASSSVPHLITALEHGGRLLRRDAARSLGQLGPVAAAAVPALVARLDDSDWHVPHLAATALGRIAAPSLEPSSPEVVAALVSAIHAGPGDSELRGAAIEALARLQPKPDVAVPVLIRAFGDRCPHVVDRAVASIAVFKADAVGPLVEALDDRSRAIRRNAARALGQIGPDAEAAAFELIETLADADASDGFFAERPLVAMGPAAVDSLIVALGDRRATVRRVAARILGQLGSFESHVTTSTHGTHVFSSLPSPACGRGVGGEGFSRFASPPPHPQPLSPKGRGELWTRAVDALARLLADRNPYVQSQAAYALGNVGRPARAATEPLQTATHDESPMVRRAARWALERVGS